MSNVKKFVEKYKGYDVFKDKYGYMAYVKGELLHCFGTLERCKQLINEKLKDKRD